MDFTMVSLFVQIHSRGAMFRSSTLTIVRVLKPWTHLVTEVRCLRSEGWKQVDLGESLISSSSFWSRWQKVNLLFSDTFSNQTNCPRTQEDCLSSQNDGLGFSWSNVYQSRSPKVATVCAANNVSFFGPLLYVSSKCKWWYHLQFISQPVHSW